MYENNIWSVSSISVAVLGLVYKRTTVRPNFDSSSFVTKASSKALFWAALPAPVVLLLSLDHLSSFCSIGVQAYDAMTKFQPYKLFLVERSENKRSYIRRCEGRNLDGLGFRFWINVQHIIFWFLVSARVSVIVKNILSQLLMHPPLLTLIHTSVLVFTDIVFLFTTKKSCVPIS